MDRILSTVNTNGCGGTLIGPNVVLSAAHCGSRLGQFVIIGSTRVDIIQERRHPSYNSSTQENDFYLFKLRSAVTTSGARVTLNSNWSLPTTGQSLTAIGLGLTSSTGGNGGTPATSLRDVAIRAISDANCQAAWGSLFKANVMLCAGAAGKDSCRGDSGGPLVIRNGLDHVLTGVVSWGGRTCAQAATPGVYARVSSAITWIKSVACTEWSSSVSGLCSTTFVPATYTKLTVQLRTDDWPEENFITLYNARSTIWSYMYTVKNANYKYSKWISNDDCTTLAVSDTYGDGLSGSGRVTVTYGTRVLYDDWNLGYGFYMRLGNRC
jgi:secreted trypsin-like serine protease